MAEKGIFVKALVEKPTLLPEASPFWEAYLQLARSRSSGFSGPSPISTSDIYSWLAIQGIYDQDVRLAFYEILTAMDTAFFEIVQEEQDANSSSSNRREKGQPGR